VSVTAEQQIPPFGRNDKMEMVGTTSGKGGWYRIPEVGTEPK